MHERQSRMCLCRRSRGRLRAAGGVTNQPFVYIPMSPTAVDDSTGFLPPADQPGGGPQLQTNDDRFLNAVFKNGEIWTADGTSCEPSGDTMQRDCLDYVEIAASATSPSPTPTLTNQIDNVGINSDDLFYPAVSLDSAGDLITVFDELSTSIYPSIEDASIASTGTTLSAFQTLHTSSTYYDGNDLFNGACDSNGCRWGDYSGAAEDPSNPKDVWVVSGSADGSTSVVCTTIHACWNTHIDDLTVSGPTITALTPSLGPIVGGQTVTVTGLDFGTDTTATFGGASIAISNLTATSFTFVTPPGSGTDLVVATDRSRNRRQPLTYTYIGLANYTPLSPYRILDTRNTGGPLGPGAIRALQVTGSGASQIPARRDRCRPQRDRGERIGVEPAHRVSVWDVATECLESQLRGAHGDREPGDGHARRQRRRRLDQHLQRARERQCARRRRGVLRSAGGRGAGRRDSSIRSRRFASAIRGAPRQHRSAASMGSSVRRRRWRSTSRRRAGCRVTGLQKRRW